MSGVYIKGMEMPKTGEYRCVIRKWGEEITIDLYGNEELCGTLVPVPDHGRLIDADAMQEEWYRLNFDRKITDGTLAYWNYRLSQMPTIIPAEEVYASGYDTAGNYHWTETQTGEHTIPADKGGE